MSVSRTWLALTLALFSLPLFVGLGRRDLQGDEAGHSFSVDRILEIGDWLAPKSSPSETAVFLEKPPLKFWIVAAPIKLGLLPHDEFGLRFWDALFGGIAFLYVFAIGNRLAGNLCGAVAVLILFVHNPLLFEHGLRGNNMEAPLLLCYCGGVYHYLAWSAAERAGSRRLHALAVGLYFVLGFMTKFVAALFLPMVLAAATLLFRPWRTKLARDWRAWVGAVALTLALIAPWFVYTQFRFGMLLWQVMFGAHVYTRLTSYLNPAHVQPWPYYFVSMYHQFTDSQTTMIVSGGVLLLLIQTVRSRWPEGATILLWFALPLLVISAGTSKLYHYVYPFLPPVALAGGYLVGVVFSVVPGPIVRGMRATRERMDRWLPRVIKACDQPVVRTVILALALAAVGVAAVSLVHGPVRITIGHTEVFKSSGVLRPCAVIVVAGVLTGAPILISSRVAVLLVVASLLPLSVYRDALARLETGDHPMRSARDCVLRVAAQADAASTEPRGLWVDGLDRGFGHEHYYYFRKIQPWAVAPQPSPERLTQYLYDPAEWRPMLVLDSVYHQFTRGGAGSAAPTNAANSPPMVSFGDVVLLLPGPYAVCSSETARPE